jgi:hypothetical protein
MAVTTKNAIFLDVTPRGSCKNWRFRGMYRLHQQGNKNRRARNNISSNQQLTHAVKKYYVLVFFSQRVSVAGYC